MGRPTKAQAEAAAAEATPRRSSRSRSRSVTRAGSATPTRRVGRPKKVVEEEAPTSVSQRKPFVQEEESPVPVAAAPVAVPSEPVKVEEKKQEVHDELDRLTGPFGAVMIMLGLPILLQLMWYSCTNTQCDMYTSVFELYSIFQSKGFCGAWEVFFPSPTLKAVMLLCLWVGFEWLLHVIIPGRIFLGSEFFDGKKKTRLNYKLNGLACFLISIAAMLSIYNFAPANTLSILVDEFGPLLSAFNILAYGLSAVLHLKGLIYKQGNPSGNALIDYFYGYEANPRIFDIITTDFKFFFESRALILWVVFNVAISADQASKTGGPAILSLWLVNIFQFIYVAHFFVVEENVLSMIDFTAENMGWMLTYGNIMWVPFLYCGQAWYLWANSNDISILHAVCCVAVFCLGYTIFAQANTQKHHFIKHRSEPEKARIWGRAPSFLKTSSGRNLLTDGWWGVGRHMNYTGDLLIALSFSLPAGLPTSIGHVVPYLYFIFLTVLLLQRERRDDAWCKLKYGKDWDEYCKVVRYRMIPGLY